MISPARFVGGEKTRYFVRSVRTGREKKLLDISPLRQEKGGFAFANRVISRAAEYPVVVVDEFGPIENSGSGFFRCLVSVSRKAESLVVTVRPELLSAAAEKLGAKKFRVIKISENGGIEKLISRTVKWLSKSKI